MNLITVCEYIVKEKKSVFNYLSNHVLLRKPQPLNLLLFLKT